MDILGPLAHLLLKQYYHQTAIPGTDRMIVQTPAYQTPMPHVLSPQNAQPTGLLTRPTPKAPIDGFVAPAPANIINEPNYAVQHQLPGSKPPIVMVRI